MEFLTGEPAGFVISRAGEGKGKGCRLVLGSIIAPLSSLSAEPISSGVSRAVSAGVNAGQQTSLDQIISGAPELAKVPAKAIGHRFGYGELHAQSLMVRL